MKTSMSSVLEFIKMTHSATASVCVSSEIGAAHSGNHDNMNFWHKSGRLARRLKSSLADYLPTSEVIP